MGTGASTYTDWHMDDLEGNVAVAAEFAYALDQIAAADDEEISDGWLLLEDWVGGIQAAVMEGGYPDVFLGSADQILRERVREALAAERARRGLAPLEPA